MVTGTSVLGIKFDGGVMLAADTLGSYGSMARFRSLPRLCGVGDFTCIGGSGDMSDFQYISSHLQE
jgi:20S proteasome subunit beta 7